MPSSFSTPDSSLQTDSAAFSDIESYQAVSRAAVIGFILAIFGVLSLWFIPLICIPVIGLIASFIGFQNILKFPVN